MNLKPYQQEVISDLERFLACVRATNNTHLAFNQFWQNHPRTPIVPTRNEAIEPYKNNIARVPHVCVKVPTAGGKTYIACNAIQPIFDGMGLSQNKVVVWLVPSVTIRDQTLQNLRAPSHPYRQRLNLHFQHRVEVLDKESALQGVGFSADSVRENLTIVVLSFASLRAKNKDDRRVNYPNSYLQSFEKTVELDNEDDDITLMNVLQTLRPVVVVDESHNAESELSVEMLGNLKPSFILDLTATPRQNSNIISFVDALALKKQNMVKLPVIVSNHRHKDEVILTAINLRKKLETEATIEAEKTGKYIRPIVLFQAQSKNETDATTFQDIKTELVKLHKIPAEQIKIKTATIDELKGVDLLSRDCAVRYIITINALKEGWDCPFAYILASLGNRSSAVDVEQIVGRVLRQPYVMLHKSQMLNMSFTLTASEKFLETLDNIVKGLNKAGFSERDCRLAEIKELPPPQPTNPNQTTLDFGQTPPSVFPHSESFETVFETTNEPTETIDNQSVSTTNGGTNFSESQSENEAKNTPSVFSELDEQIEVNVAAITAQAEKQSNIMAQTVSETHYSLPTELSQQVKSYSIRQPFKALAADLQLPQFFMTLPSANIFMSGEMEVILEKENLMEGFDLSKCDTHINFVNAVSQFYKVDIDETSLEHTPHFEQLTAFQQKTIYDYYLAPERKGERVKNFSTRLYGQMTAANAVKDQNVYSYIRRIMLSFTDAQFEHLSQHEASYLRLIKQKISDLSKDYAEKQFYTWLKTNRIFTKTHHVLPTQIRLNQTAKAIPKSLYEKEGSMNGLEERVINEIANAENVVFWTRNVENTGFKLNGFFNHFPDFIVRTQSGKTLLIETKGDDRTNDDSRQKLKLGQQWELKAGDSYKYFMVFEKSELEGAFKLDNFMTILRQL